MAAIGYLEQLTKAMAASEPAALVTVVEGDLAGRHLVAGPAGVLASEIPDPALAAALAGLAAGALAQGGGKPGTRTVAGVRVYLEAFMPPPVLVVVGAGHVAQPVAEIGKMIGFEVIVIDDRAEYANTARFPTADRVICDSFVPAVQGLGVGPRHHLVLVTRGHRHDMDCLRAVIGAPVAYIGMIGSRTRVETVFRLLVEEDGVDPALFGKVYAPIGLDVGARSPAEIAVAVAGELLKVRYGGSGESLSRLGRDRIHGR